MDQQAKDPPKVRVLICDDEVDLREALCRRFEKKGFEVFMASNGVEGYDVCLKSDIEVVITDIRMPGGSGSDLLDRLKKDLKDKSPSVICMSAFSDLSLEGAYGKGADALFLKPLDVDALIAATRHFYGVRQDRLRRFGVESR